MSKHNSILAYVRIAISCAEDYHRLLENKNYLFLYEDRATHRLMYYETVFLPRHYMHLTGLRYTDTYKSTLRLSAGSMGASYFYKECLDKTIQARNVTDKSDSTTALKMAALPQLIHFIRRANMTVVYNGSHPYLACDRLAGSSKFALGFTEDHGYYVPSSCLNEDIRNLGNHPSRIMAIFCKDVKESIYKDICYVARKVPLNELYVSESYNQLVSLENYQKRL